MKIMKKLYRKHVLMLLILILSGILTGEGYDFFQLNATYDSIKEDSLKNNYTVTVQTNITREGKYAVTAVNDDNWRNSFIKCCF